MAILVKKYGEMDDQGLMSSLSDAKTISQGDKSVSTKCSGFSDVTIDIRYYDHELKTLAEVGNIQKPNLANLYSLFVGKQHYKDKSQSICNWSLPLDNSKKIKFKC
mgnify:CR=1 FL=1